MDHGSARLLDEPRRNLRQLPVADRFEPGYPSLRFIMLDPWLYSAFDQPLRLLLHLDQEVVNARAEMANRPAPRGLRR